MTARKAWADLAPATQAKRFEKMAANHIPTPKHVVTFAQQHAKCANRGRCTGPGCRVTK